MSPAEATGWQVPPYCSIRASFDGDVETGTTAMNGSPRSWAKYASLTAVDPLEDSMIVWPSWIQPLHSA